MRSAETVFEMEGVRMLQEALPETAIGVLDVDRGVVIDFIRDVQREAYARGKKDGFSEGVKAGPGSLAETLLELP